MESLPDRFIIRSVQGRWIVDSRGIPTIEVEVKTGGGRGRAAAPAGASRGSYEAVELRDGNNRFGGKGVSKAVSVVNNIIAPRLKGLDSRRQRLIDIVLCKLDGTPNKSRLGGNTIVATSLAVAKAAANTIGVELFEYLGGPGAYVIPVPFLNIINGGVHAGNELSFQEFMIVPVGFDTFSDALAASLEVYMKLKSILKTRYGASAVNVGDEGGFAPPLRENREALTLLVDAIREAGYTEDSIVLAIDAAASQFYRDGKYLVDGKELDTDAFLEYYLDLVNEFPIKSIEDPFHEDEYSLFAKLTQKLRQRNILVVGDDLYVTNLSRLLKGIEMRASTAILVKVNQVGTLSETIDVVHAAFNAGMRAIISHRSGETEDTSIAHLAVGLRTGIIKAGAPARGERTAKYNELLRIEEALSGEAVYPGWNVFRIGYPITGQRLLQGGTY